jgi:membrane protein implicated in regulation of membrane protease activity
MNFYIYLVIAFLCFIGEMFTMEFSLTCIGIGLLGSAYASYVGFGLWWQVGIFAAVAVVAWLSVRPLALRYLYRNTKTVKTPAQSVIGQEAVVEIAIDPLAHTGRVKVNGESWKADGAEALAVGTRCTVEKLDGVTLFVKKI